MKRPRTNYSFYDEIESLAMARGSFEQISQSNVILVHNVTALLLGSDQAAAAEIPLEKNSTAVPIRLGRVLSFISSVVFGKDDATTVELASILAVLDFNNRESPYGTIFPKDCNFFLTVDTTKPADGLISLARLFQDNVLLYGARKEETTTPRPMAILGGTTSVAAALLGTLGSATTTTTSREAVENEQIDTGAKGVLVISPVASSSYLDRIPLFARTMTTTFPYAETVCIYLHSIGVRHLGVLYSNDVLGSSYLLDLFVSAHKHNILLSPVSYNVGIDEDLEQTMASLHRTGLRYFFGILGVNTWSDVVVRLHQAELIGKPEYVWIFAETVSSVFGLDLDQTKEPDSTLLKALDRSAIVSLKAASTEKLAIHNASFHEVLADPAFLDFWDSLSDDQPSRDGFLPRPTVFSMLAYDAILALGLGACETNNTQLFTGSDLLDRIRLLHFEGSSGTVHFNTTTASRDPGGLIFRISNIAFNGEAGGAFRAADIPCIEFNPQTEELHVVLNVTFQSGSSVPPPATAVQPQNLNLVPLGIRVVVWLLAAGVLLLSCYYAGWTITHRNNKQVRASQPLFLVIVCFGTLLIGASMPISTLQEPESALDHGCMAFAWLLSIGSSLIFSALFSKTWRINKIYQSARRFRRIELRARDVLWPILVVAGLDVAVLTAWTVRCCDPMR